MIVMINFFFISMLSVRDRESFLKFESELTEILPMNLCHKQHFSELVDVRFPPVDMSTPMIFLNIDFLRVEPH